MTIQMGKLYWNDKMYKFCFLNRLSRSSRLIKLKSYGIHLTNKIVEHGIKTKKGMWAITEVDLQA